MKQIVLLSDTHHTLDERFFPHFKNADEIWHAGDIGSIEIIDILKTHAPIKAVWGNIQFYEYSFFLNIRCSDYSTSKFNIQFFLNIRFSE